jgi:acetyl coenzyme A synthetase (ADP forming)-like protein
MAGVLEGFLAPRSVAVVGAAREEGKVGHLVFDDLLEAGFPGPVYPVNPNADEIHGHRCFASVKDIPGGVDLAVIVVPPARVAAAVEQCGAAGCHSAIVITAGFKETGREGAVLERELVETARRAGVRLLGPNCLGLLATPAHLNASFAGTMPAPGTIAFMSQSGALGTAILDWAAGEDIGLAYFASLGNKADVSEIDFLKAWRDDANAGVVAGYLESVIDGPGFVEAARDLTSVKPFIVLKGGRSDLGARAVSSHTGSLAGSETAYEAAFRAAGVIRAHTVQALFDYAIAFSLQPLPQRRGLAILTNAGGPAIMATDSCDYYGVTLASLEQETITALHEALPAAAALYNPVDVLGDATAERYRTAIRILAADPNVGALLVILTPQATTEIAETAELIAQTSRETDITMLACFMGESLVRPGWAILGKAGVPHYAFPERAVRALAAMHAYRDHLTRTIPLELELSVDAAAVRPMIEAGVAARHGFITGEDATAIARAYGIASPRGVLARDLASARALTAEIGYPLVMKIASPDILHKSDIGGIRLGLADEAQLTDAYEDIMAGVRNRMPEAQVWGVELQEMVPAGTEVIVGVNRDPTFGPLLMFGLGGVYVEVLKDVTFRLCPVSAEEARAMISEIRSFALLRGARGGTAADIDAIVDVLTRVSRLAMDFPEILELDINPLIVHERGGGAIAADIRIGIGGDSR